MSQEKKITRKQTPIQEVATLVSSAEPLIWVTTHEENRFIGELINTIAKPANLPVITWSQHSGLRQAFPSGEDLSITAELPPKLLDPTSTKQLTGALQAIEDLQIEDVRVLKNGNPDLASQAKGVIFLFKDPNPMLVGKAPRQIRDILTSLTDERKILLFLSPTLSYGQNSGIEPTLEKSVSIVNYSLPTREYLETIIRRIIQEGKEQWQILLAEGKVKAEQTFRTDYTDEEYYDFSRALQGLTSQEAESACAICLRLNRELIVDTLCTQKKVQLRRSDILEYIEPAAGLSEVGGLDNLKVFIRRYQQCHTKEAIQYGVEPLRGAMLVGLPGCGKSLVAKNLATEWGLPLIRLDIGRVMAGLVGQSEGNMRTAIKMAESVAPCVLWCDEVEKAISGTKSSGQTDGGTMSRVFGTLLTAMQEGMTGVTLIVTANDITAVPPEFIRRFDEVFFVDLPGPSERKEIFSIHINKKKRDPTKFDLDKLSKEAKNFTGDEIRKVIKEGLIRAFAGKDEDVTTEHISAAIKETKPLYTIMEEQIEKIREWAHGRARYASSYAEKINAPGNQTVGEQELSIDDACKGLSDITVKKNSRTDTTNRAGTGRLQSVIDQDL